MLATPPRAPGHAVLVDASPYLFRAYFALPDSIRDPTGRSVNAVYGFADFLVHLIAEEAPSHLAVCFDGSLTTSFRNEIYPEYKAQREPPPEDLKRQQADCRRVAGALGAVALIDDRLEADDLLGSLVTLLEPGERVERITLVTSDKDLCQLVSEETTLLDYAAGRRFGPEQVREKFGVRADQMVDYLALAGDPVDNIPGVAGVGPKTAAALLGEFGSVADLLDDLSRVGRSGLRGAAGLERRLSEQRDRIELSFRLAGVVTDHELGLEAEELRYGGVPESAWRELCEELGFGRLLDQGLKLGAE